MAWISVHEQLKDHHKLRHLSKLLKCSRHEALGVLVSLWLWGINNADRTGNLNGADENDIADGIMYRGQSAEILVECLLVSGWMEKVEGHFILHDWDMWQDQWFKALDRREADTKRKREERSSKKEMSTDSPQDIPEDSQQDVRNSPSPSPSPSPSGKAIDEFFESVWELYPKKEGKGQVKPAQRKKLYAIGYEKVKACVEAYKKAKSGTDRQYLQNGSTFFNSGYIDYLDAEPPQEPTKLKPILIKKREESYNGYSPGA
jgi:hypothetical protein